MLTTESITQAVNFTGPDWARSDSDHENISLLSSHHETGQNQAALNHILEFLNSFDVNNVPKDWSAIKKDFSLLELTSRNDKEKDESEHKLKQLLANLDEDSSFLTTDSLNKLANNLFQLLTITKNKKDFSLHFEFELLNNLINKRRMFNNNDYSATEKKLNDFSHENKLTLTDNIFRYAVGFNAGLGAGNVVYGIAVTIMGTLPVVVGAGISSLILCTAIANYFKASYKDEDKNIATELTNFKRTIHFLAMREGLLRSECYTHLVSNMQLMREVDHENKSEQPLYADLNKTIATLSTPNLVLAMDSFIDGKINEYPDEIAISVEIDNIQVDKPNSIYTKMFHSKHWGPVLSFFGATGTVFGVTKSILDLVGVTLLMGSAASLLLVIAAAAIVMSGAFAIKHWIFNQKSEERKDTLEKFKNHEMKMIKVKCEKLKKIKSALKKDTKDLDIATRQEVLASTNPQLAKEVAHQVEAKTNAAHDNYAVTQHNFFKSPSNPVKLSTLNKPNLHKRAASL